MRIKSAISTEKDFFITFFVAGIFGLGIYVGIKLYRWNMQDFKARKERNERIRSQQKNQKK